MFILFFRWSDLTGPKEGFYLSHQIRNGKQTAILAVEVENNSKKKTENAKSKKDQLFQVYRPNTGLQFRNETLGELEKKYKKVLLKLNSYFFIIGMNYFSNA